MSAETLAVAMRTGTYLETQSWKPLVLMGRLGWVDANDAHRFEWTNAAASAPASAPASPPRWLDDDDPFAAAAGGGGGGAGPSAASPYEREREFPEFQEFPEFPRRDSATSASFFSNEGIGGDFGTLTARASPPTSDEPAEDVKFSRVADLSRDFSERVRALGLNNDVYLLALRTCGWDIYDAHEWLDRMLREEERRAAEAAAGVAVEAGGGFYDGPDGFEYPARSFESREWAGSTGGYAPPGGGGGGGGGGWNEWGESFDYRTLHRRDREADDARRLRAAAGPAPVLAPSNPIGAWGSRRPAPDRIRLRNLQNAFPDIDPGVVEDTLYGDEAAGDVDWAAARLNEMDAERRHNKMMETAAAAAEAAARETAAAAAAAAAATAARQTAAAAAEGASQNGSGGDGGESRLRKSKTIVITREMLQDTRWSGGGGTNGSAKAFVETVMHQNGDDDDDDDDDDESRVLEMARDRQGGCHAGDPRMDRDRSVAGRRQNINRFHDERATKRACMDKLIGLKRQATARRDHSTARTLQADIIKVRGEIEELTAKVNKLAAVTFKTDGNASVGAIDLHGFTMEGARKKFIAALGAALELHGGLEVIVGKGSHSGAHGSVIGPMVKKMLNKHKVMWDSEGGKVVIRWA